MNPKRGIALGRAKTLRRVMTNAEMRLWYHLRAHRFLGIKFKRQKPIGPYIVDFACPALRLVIEIDGGQHSNETGYDRQRDAWLQKHGYIVLRFWNNDVMKNTEGVLEQIAAAVRQNAPSPPAPLPKSGEGCVVPPSPLPQAGEGSRDSSRPRSKSGEGCIERFPA